MYRISILFFAMACLVLGIILGLAIHTAGAQSAPAWDLTVSPHYPALITTGDTGTITITVSPGLATSETVSVTTRSGLQLLSAQASDGAYTNGVWAFTRPSQTPATLVLTVLVLPTAQTNDAVYARADWRGDYREAKFALSLAPPTPAPSYQLFLPVVNLSEPR